jgi:hypothetical protein
MFTKKIFSHIFYDTGGGGARSFAGEVVGTQFYEGKNTVVLYMHFVGSNVHRGDIRQGVPAA